jgi:chemotaxis protein MotB
MLRDPTTARALALLLLLLSSACVKKGTYETALGELARTEAQLEAANERVANLELQVESLESEMAAEAVRRDSVEARNAADFERRRELLADDLEEARLEVRRLETVLGHRGAEYQSLQRRLEALGALEQEVRERNAIYEDVISRFRSLLDGGQLTVSIARGRMVIQLPQDVLFTSGSATLGAEGRRVLGEVGTVLADFEDRRFQIEGHTDNVPIATAQFPSNWELSSARALAVVKLLAQQGVPATSLSGAAYGEHQPVAPNDDRDSRRLNRRIEIVMLPNLDLIATEQIPGR